MVKRKKRLEKGIESLGKQIKLHEEKRENAIRSGNIDLESYYKKEIKNFKETQERKKKMLEKQ